MEGAENCTDACVCRVLVVCEAPVWVITKGGDGNTCTEVVARTVSGREPEDEEGGVGGGDGVCDGTTTAVMTGIAVVVDVSS